MMRAKFSSLWNNQVFPTSGAFTHIQIVCVCGGGEGVSQLLKNLKALELGILCILKLELYQIEYELESFGRTAI